MNGFTTYCDLDFLVRFYKAAPNRDAAAYTEEDDLWREVRRFLGRHTAVVVNATIDEAQAKAPALLDLIASGRFRNFTFDPERFRGVGEAAFHAGCPRPVAFLVEDVDHEGLTARFGALFVPFEGLYDVWRRLGRPITLNIGPDCKAGCLKSWADLRTLAGPTTSVVVSDPYLVGEITRTGTFERNLGGLLLALLPAGPNEVPVRVAVVSDLFDSKRGLIAHPEEIKIRIEGFLEQQRPHLRVAVAVVQPRRGPHDRRVFTDYGFFKSGHGLDYFGKDGDVIKETTLDYAPAFDADTHAIAAEKLRVVAKAAAQPALAPLRDGLSPLRAGEVEGAFPMNSAPQQLG